MHIVDEVYCRKKIAGRPGVLRNYVELKKKCCPATFDKLTYYSLASSSGKREPIVSFAIFYIWELYIPPFAAEFAISKKHWLTYDLFVV